MFGTITYIFSVKKYTSIKTNQVFGTNKIHFISKKGAGGTGEDFLFFFFVFLFRNIDSST